MTDIYSNRKWCGKCREPKSKELTRCDRCNRRLRVIKHQDKYTIKVFRY